MRRLWRRCRWLQAGAFTLAVGCASWDAEHLQPTNSPVVEESTWTPIESAPAGSTATAKGSEEITVAPLQQIAAQQPAKSERFRLPPNLPGTDVAPIQLPPLKGLPQSEREKKIREAFPALAPLPASPQPGLPESGKPYSLAELQQIALNNNPAIKRAAADADAASGLMLQAGLYPNPHFGYQGDQIQPGNKPTNNAGQQGAFLQQVIKTAGKLSLAKAAASWDYANAQVALRRTELDVINDVRIHYYAALVSRETMQVSRTLAELADEVYGLQLRYVASGEAAGYEPLQMYAQAAQARNVYVQASNRYIASWKQLAATLGNPALPLQALEGRVDAAPPHYEAEPAWRRISEFHTDVLTAENSISRADFQLRLAKATPVPDVSISAAFQRDYSTGNDQASVQVGVVLPLFDRNQGNIRAAMAQATRSLEDLKARQLDLSARLAEAMARYQSSQAVVENYRERMLPNLSRAYQGIIQRYQGEPDKVSFNDIVVAQQSFGQALNAYLIAVGEQWAAVLDVANLLQIDDLYGPLDVHPAARCP
jgi:cobalt-zinc-cadmium efflux system outer membrane protein